MVVTEIHLFVATSRADLLVYLCCPTRRGGAHGYTAAQPKGDLTEGDILRSDRRVLKTHKSPTQGDMRIPIEACFTIKLTTAAAQKGTRISSSQGSWHVAGYKDTPPSDHPATALSYSIEALAELRQHVELDARCRWAASSTRPATPRRQRWCELDQREHIDRPVGKLSRLSCCKLSRRIN